VEGRFPKQGRPRPPRPRGLAIAKLSCASRIEPGLIPEAFQPKQHKVHGSNQVRTRPLRILNRGSNLSDQGARGAELFEDPSRPRRSDASWRPVVCGTSSRNLFRGGNRPSAHHPLTERAKPPRESRFSKASELAAAQGGSLYTIGLEKRRAAPRIRIIRLLVDDVVFRRTITFGVFSRPNSCPWSRWRESDGPTPGARRPDERGNARREVEFPRK